MSRCRPAIFGLFLLGVDLALGGVFLGAGTTGSSCVPAVLSNSSLSSSLNEKLLFFFPPQSKWRIELEYFGIATTETIESKRIIPPRFLASPPLRYCCEQT